MGFPPIDGGEFQDRVIGLTQGELEGKAGMMMTVIVYTRRPKTERGVGWEKKNLIVFEQNQLTARGLPRVRLFTADVDAEGP